jgi:hypothetical protein
MNWDLAAITATNAEAVTEMAKAAQRALATRVLWTPADAAAAVRAEMLPLWPEISPAAVRDMLTGAAGLAVANGSVGLPESIAI